MRLDIRKVRFSYIIEQWIWPTIPIQQLLWSHRLRSSLLTSRRSLFFPVIVVVIVSVVVVVDLNHSGRWAASSHVFGLFYEVLILHLTM